MARNVMYSTIVLPNKLGQWYNYKKNDEVENQYQIDGHPGFEVIGPDRFFTIRNKIQQILEKMVKKLEEKFSVGIEMHAFNFRQVKFSEFNLAADRKYVISKKSNNKFSYTMYFDQNIAAALLGSVIGGNGIYGEFTPLELNLSEIYLLACWDIVSELLDEPISQYVFESEVTYRETNSLLLENEGYYLFSMEVKIGKSELGQISFAFNKRSLDNFVNHIKDFGVHVNINLKPESQEKVKVIAKANLGGATLTLKDLFNMQSGDVIKLDQRLSEDIVLSIGEDFHFLSKIGKSNNNLALQLKKKVKRAEIYAEKNKEQLVNENEQEFAMFNELNEQVDDLADIKDFTAEEEIDWDA